MKRQRLNILVAVVFIASGLVIARDPSAPPATQTTADSVNDFILSNATTKPTTTTFDIPDSSPFKHKERQEGRGATVTFSDGHVLSGRITTTFEKPLRIWVAERGEYADIPFATVKSCVASVLWERDEKEYQFLTSGSDVKTYNGRSYPARETVYAFTLTDGSIVKGGIVVPFTLVEDSGVSTLIVLHKRDKGDVGKVLKDLVYVTSVEFSD